MAIQNCFSFFNTFTLNPNFNFLIFEIKWCVLFFIIRRHCSLLNRFQMALLTLLFLYSRKYLYIRKMYSIFTWVLPINFYIAYLGYFGLLFWKILCGENIYSKNISSKIYVCIQIFLLKSTFARRNIYTEYNFIQNIFARIID